MATQKQTFFSAHHIGITILFILGIGIMVWGAFFYHAQLKTSAQGATISFNAFSHDIKDAFSVFKKPNLPQQPQDEVEVLREKVFGN